MATTTTPQNIMTQFKVNWSPKDDALLLLIIERYSADPKNRGPVPWDVVNADWKRFAEAISLNTDRARCNDKAKNSSQARFSNMFRKGSERSESRFEQAKEVILDIIILLRNADIVVSFDRNEHRLPGWENRNDMYKLKMGLQVAAATEANRRYILVRDAEYKTKQDKIDEDMRVDRLLDDMDEEDS